MKILAFSDLHGRRFKEAAALIEKHQPDWIVLTGDMLPDFDMVSGVENRLECQRNFWKTHGHRFESPNCPTTFIRGNHELEGFQVPERHQRLPPGLETSVLRLEGYPSDEEVGTAGRALSPGGLAAELFSQLHANPGATIVLSHVPPYEYGDQSAPFVSIGHKPLAVWLESRAIGPHGLVLCGHVHESFGITLVGEEARGKTLVVNLAGGYALVDFTSGRWRIHSMQLLEHLAADQDFSDVNEYEEP